MVPTRVLVRTIELVHYLLKQASSLVRTSAALISFFFQFRYDIEFIKYSDIDFDIKYVSKMLTFLHCRLKI